MYNIYFTPAARADLLAAMLYYNSKIEGLGDRLFNELEAVLETMASNPKTFSFRYNAIRAGKIKSFPYLVFYNINERELSIDILRIFNTHQEPFNIL